MKTFYAIAISAAVLITIGLGFKFYKFNFKSAEDLKSQTVKQKVSLSLVTAEPKTKKSPTSVTREDGISLWPEYEPLAPDEIAEFNLAEKEIERFYHWGRISTDKVEQFRATIYHLGERGVAHYGRELASLKSDDIKERDDAEAVIKKIDLVNYFASLNRPIALDVIENLATRPVTWTDDGKLVDGLQATVTLEAFDVYSKVKPESAVNYVKTINQKHRGAYVVHYIYGRRLAGLKEEDIRKEVAAAFGPEFIVNEKS